MILYTVGLEMLVQIQPRSFVVNRILRSTGSREFTRGFESLATHQEITMFNDDENESYSERAVEIENEMVKALEPIFTKYRAQGVRSRQLFYMAVQAAQEIQIEQLLGIRK